MNFSASLSDYILVFNFSYIIALPPRVIAYSLSICHIIVASIEKFQYFASLMLLLPQISLLCITIAIFLIFIAILHSCFDNVSQGSNATIFICPFVCALKLTTVAFCMWCQI